MPVAAAGGAPFCLVTCFAHVLRSQLQLGPAVLAVSYIFYRALRICTDVGVPVRGFAALPCKKSSGYHIKAFLVLVLVLCGNG